MIIAIFANCEVCAEQNNYDSSKKPEVVQYLYKPELKYEEHICQQIIYFISKIHNNNNNTIIFYTNKYQTVCDESCLYRFYCRNGKDSDVDMFYTSRKEETFMYSVDVKYINGIQRKRNLYVRD